MSAQWVFPASTVDRIIDGDSFTARVSRSLDFGFHVLIEPSSIQRFRVNGCAAAPKNTLSGAGAREALATLLFAAPFTLTSVGPYKYGDEWMAEVLLADGRRLTDVLIADQWAAPWDGSGKQPLPPWPRTVG